MEPDLKLFQEIIVFNPPPALPDERKVLETPGLNETGRSKESVKFTKRRDEIRKSNPQDSSRGVRKGTSLSQKRSKTPRKLSQMVLKEYQSKWVGKGVPQKRKEIMATKQKAAVVKQRLVKGKLALTPSTKQPVKMQSGKRIKLKSQVKLKKPKQPSTKTVKKFPSVAPIVAVPEVSTSFMPRVSNPAESQELSKKPLSAKEELLQILEGDDDIHKDPSIDLHWTSNIKLDIDKSAGSSIPTQSVVPPETPIPISFTDAQETDQTRKTSQALSKGTSRRRRKTGQFPCEHCGVKMESAFKLGRHITKIHQQDLSKCPSCLRQFKQGYELWRHFKKIHLRSSGSGKKQTEIAGFVDLNKIPIVPGATICDTCGQEFTNSATLRRHLHEIHGEGSRRENFLMCPECGRSYKNKDTLNAHIRQVHIGESFRCDICARMCQGAGKLWRHKVQDHAMLDLPPPAGLTVYKCEYCGEKLLRGLDAHIKKHHPNYYKQFQDKQKEMDKFNSIGKRKLTKTEQYSIFREMGAEAVARGLCPRWFLPRECPICKKIVKGVTFHGHLKTHEANASALTIPQPPQISSEPPKKKLRDEIKRILVRKKLLKVQKSGGGAMFKCMVCNHEVWRFPEMKVHFVSIHPDVCNNLMDMKPLSKQAEASKLIPSTPMPPHLVNCGHCSEANLSESSLRSHLESVHPEKCWKCPKCSKVMLNPEEMRSHFVAGCNDDCKNDAEADGTVGDGVEENKKNNCKRCEVVCGNVDLLRSHVQQSHPNEYHPCPLCHHLSHTGRGLLLHISLTHRSNADCDQVKAIKKSWVSYDLLKVPCQICGRDVSLEYYQQQHLKKVHGIVENCLFSCPICKMEYQRRWKFLTHVEEDHGHVVDMKDFIDFMKTIQANLDNIEIKNPERKTPIGKKHKCGRKSALKKKATSKKSTRTVSFGQPTRRGRRPKKRRRYTDSSEGLDSDSDFEFDAVPPVPRTAGRRGRRGPCNRRSLDWRSNFNEQEMEYMQRCFVRVEKLDALVIQQYCMPYPQLNIKQELLDT